MGKKTSRGGTRPKRRGRTQRQPADLRYVTDAMPGLRRRRTKSGFRYVGPDGEPVLDSEALERVRRLAIPPAWTDVWISPLPKGHLQATGRDARGRKQYRYHPHWRATRDAAKYDHLVAFANALPRIREQTQHDLALRGLPREKVLAGVVGLLETALIRVGNEQYVRENASYGLTTLRNRHVRTDGSDVRLSFRGKSGKHHVVSFRNQRLARLVKRCQELPGQLLFQYVDEDDQLVPLGSSDVNDYLRATTGEEITAKDFRTWAGTVAVARALDEDGPPADERQAKANILHAIDAAAVQLGNTRAICRASYVHPAILEAYTQGITLSTVEPGNGAPDGLTAQEARVLALLQRATGAKG